MHPALTAQSLSLSLSLSLSPSLSLSLSHTHTHTSTHINSVSGRLSLAISYPGPPLPDAVVQEINVSEGGAAHHGVSKVLQGGDVRVSRADPVVGEREEHERPVAGKPR